MLFQRRFEEGYDLYDPLYQKWLELEHPEVATSYNSESSILSLFPEAPIVNPVEIIDDSNNPGNSTESLNGAQPSVSNLLENTQAIESLNGISTLPANTEAIESPNRAQPSITNLPANTEAMSNTQCKNSLSVTNKENISNKSGHSTTTLSKYLNTPAITKPKSSTCAITTARVLTSAECLDIIRQKEMKKKAEEEAKQQRKRERREKKESRRRRRRKAEKG